MPDGATPRWSGAQQSMLRELGLELFVLRTAEPAREATPAGDLATARARGAAELALPREVAARVRDADAVADARDIDAPRADNSRIDEARGSDGPRGPMPRVARPARGDAIASNARARLVMLSSEPGWLRGEHAALVRSLLQALGVHESEVRGEAIEGVPAIAFGQDVPGALRAPSLAALRGAGAKRAIWPALRTLRMTLRPKSR